ncbi:dipeptidyl aminopeptidase/acylaminoacyl peptidase [Geodermatophilus bullaregiensis]|uniref:S9 family peptidase n=1 Tax=Geodermatophilus bullaregiensis TaxID=1564160 RepID=UPI00195ADFF1|nr:prolyl oligopeptidase family serine peptidase [Geodermatophilus bullaregiensis]MBM7808556.1 dipeptidyl aminopeptidase/acylaminoacyl peptidase [Geodermatophilus bullaregiensis]
MRPADLALLRTPGVPTVSPDGRMAVVAVERPDVDGDGYRAQLWAVPTDGSAPARPLTSGARDSAPAFSPDGRWLAYLSAAPGDPPQVHLLPTAGGAPRRLTDAPLGTGAPVWSPDSRRLAWVGPVPPDGADAGAPRLLTRLRPGGADEDEHTRDRPGCVFVLDLPGDPDDDGVPLPEPRQLTDGAGGDTDVAWSPDGRALAFVSARHARADRDLVRDVYLVPATGGDPRRVTRGRGRCRTPSFDPGGATLLVTARPDLGPEGLDVAGSGPTPCRVPVTGGPLEPLLDPRETHRADGTPGTVVVDGATLVGVRRAGAVELLRVPLDGRSPEPLVDGPFTVRGFAAAGGVVVATVAHDRSAGELVAITPGRRRLLTGFGRGLGATGRLHRAAELTAAADGGRVHGWVTVPDGPGPHPVLLVVSGGGWSLRDDVQVHASAGYAVVQCGPPASADAALAVLDAALADPALDAERVGVLGGGLAGALAGRTDRFGAAVVERPPAGTVPDVLDAVRTPTLVVSAERDRRCPPEEGQRLFAALQRRGVPSELLLFPGEGPDPTATDPAAAGRPRHRLARLEHLLRWWDRWLPAAEGPDPAGERAAAREGGGAP